MLVLESGRVTTAKSARPSTNAFSPRIDVVAAYRTSSPCGPRQSAPSQPRNARENPYVPSPVTTVSPASGLGQPSELVVNRIGSTTASFTSVAPASVNSAIEHGWWTPQVNRSAAFEAFAVPSTANDVEPRPLAGAEPPLWIARGPR